MGSGPDSKLLHFMLVVVVVSNLCLQYPRLPMPCHAMPCHPKLRVLKGGLKIKKPKTRDGYLYLVDGKILGSA
ncbi:hypothetical protein F4819DRAFT_331214 [Hypoxylon fuscum]|nr:hypothetical protein F4819DRAFT_331214 [Hypoxylon fuscum]